MMPVVFGRRSRLASCRQLIIVEAAMKLTYDLDDAV